ncbi:MAG: type I restriction-modification system endonuclease [Candidatus Ozemobacteraceae bacterium]
MPNVPSTNFSFLAEHDEQLFRLGFLSERYFPEDPNTSLLKLRQLAELLAQHVATLVGLYRSQDEPQFELVRRLQEHGMFTREIAQLFDRIRRSGNAANHALAGDHRNALAALKITWQLGVWFHRTFKCPQFRSGPFIPPTPPKNESEDLRFELERLQSSLSEYQKTNRETTQQLSEKEAHLRDAKDEQAFWEQMAIEAETAKAVLETQLAAQQAQFVSRPKQSVSALISAAQTAAGKVFLDEAETRLIIDQQLRQAGWNADSLTLRYSMGIRPEKGKNLAIAEWPTQSGPADYVLFTGLTPVAAVEAKRKNVDVSAALQQAKRYCRGFNQNAEAVIPAENQGKETEFCLPFAFSANGRPYLRQISTKSGIWFCDLRQVDNLSHALDGWYSPEGLMMLLNRDEQRAHQKLEGETFDYGFTLRDYQQAAIKAAEGAIGRGQRDILLAMATGTGKTKTCIALIYRLLKTQRFRRILFLVDRSALGEQAANAFKDTRMESLQSFADIFGIKEIDEQKPDHETAVHISTVQGMVRRILYANVDDPPPSIDQYDCIVVDECHRGYLLDRELSDTELEFRNFDEYISKYRRVLDYFDAFKIGLTATPALHTTQIFGLPAFSYGYREAVIDGFLIDHEPPILINTELSIAGIAWKAGENVAVYDVQRSQIDLFTTPDEIKLEVEDFNRKVLTESFNRVVCEFLASELDPSSRQKTLIFCVNDAHADLVVDQLKKAFRQQYGTVDDDAIVKITGAADKPLQLIRRFKNELNPTVAVTVDLLTTGIDVPEICHLVFLRRVNSRILYDQMLGRATRPCEKIGKELFRIFDAVRLYEALKDFSEMKPVVVDPHLGFVQLMSEFVQVKNDQARSLIRDQLTAKLQRKKLQISESTAQDFETCAGMTPSEFLSKIRSLPLSEVADWFAQKPDLAAILDRKGECMLSRVFVSDHADQFRNTERGYGRGTKPEDYLKAFSEFIKSRANDIPALIAVITRPRDLTRKHLRELAVELDRAGFSEPNLETAWRELTNRDIAARIVGYIRKAAIGDPLISFEQRVDTALEKMLVSRFWTTPQRQWLQCIAAQTKANLIVDRSALDDPDLIFKREGGGFVRLDRLFSGELQQILERFNESLWLAAA